MFVLEPDKPTLYPLSVILADDVSSLTYHICVGTDLGAQELLC